MSSKFYTNAVLTLIALFLAFGLLKSSAGMPFETNVSAQSASYKEFKLVYTNPSDAEGTGNKKLTELTKEGWKPIAISQSFQEGYSAANLTILIAR